MRTPAMRTPARFRTLVARVVASLAAFAICASAAAAQTIDPGMSRTQVVERLGRPNGQRTSGPRTYLFYRNGCEQSCGMQDLVVLENDAVVDAIFRKAGRRYTGESSSPVAVPPRAASRTRATTSAVPSDAPARPRAAAPAKRRAAAPAQERVALPPGTKRGGIVVGGDAAGAPPEGTPSARPHTVRGVAGNAAAGNAAPAGDASGADAARTRAQPGGDVRVPIVPRDTQLGVQPRERGKRTLPGPVTVPVVPRDTQVARPDSGTRRQPPPRPQQSPARPDSSTSTRPPR